MKKDYLCPACGCNLTLIMGFSSYNESKDEMCPSCGIQFNYDDAAGGDEKKRKEVYQEWRNNWIKKGMAWCGKK